MNIEELKELKRQLEEKKKRENNQNYVVIDHFTYESIAKAKESKPLTEYAAQENTEEFVKKCEKLIEETVRNLAEFGVPFDEITIYSYMGLLCKESFIRNIQMAGKDQFGDEAFDELKDQTSKTLVSLEFRVDEIGTGTEDMSIDDYNSKIIKDLLPTDSISGIVNLKVFISKMKELGYNIELINYGECSSFDDYMEAVQEYGFDTFMNVTVNLSKDLEEDTSYGTR